MRTSVRWAKVTIAVDTGVSWMWADTNKLARKNPARWSSAKGAYETITELEGYAHKARSVLVAIPGEDYHECASVSLAIEHLERKIDDPLYNLETGYDRKAPAVLGVQFIVYSPRPN